MGWPTPEHRREYERSRYRRNRDSFFQGKSCVKCGSTERLCLDHIDPALKVSHRIWQWAQARREAELAKCQVLCHPCHMRKSIEVDWPASRGYEHGKHGAHRYRSKGCRCDVCKAGSRDYMRKRRANLRQSA